MNAFFKEEVIYDFFHKRERISSRLISILVVLSIFCAIFGISQITKTYADTFDVVVEASINDTDYKLIEINNTTGDVNFYEFTDTGEAILDGNNEQTTFIPGDVDFDDRMEYLSNVVVFNSLDITSANEFALPIFSGDGYYGDTITQICYDGDSSTDYRVIQHNSFDAPFSAASIIGTLAYMEVGDTTYSGYKYTPNDVLGTWDQIPVSGDNSASSMAGMKKEPIERPAKFTIIGTTSSGKTVKIEDTGDGSGTHVYVWNDKDNDGEIDENDDNPLDDLMDEIADDMENGLGDCSVIESVDQNGNPCDIIIWFKKVNGSYIGINITAGGNGYWVFEAKNDVSQDCMAYLGYIPSSGDYNPIGAWSIGSKYHESTKYGWQNYARFDDDGNVDPDGDQMQYYFNLGTTPKPRDGVGKDGNFTCYIENTNGTWPSEPCPPL